MIKKKSLPLHWLIGGVLTLQALGSWRARVWLIEMPMEEATPLLRAAQRHWGCDWTTLERAEQHEGAGLEELPPT